jgi:hypothetical protein
MSLPKDVSPGFPATNPQTTAVATTSGAFDEKGYSDPNLVTPNSTFPYVMPDGSSKTFYKGMPVVVSPGVKAALTAAGLVS